MMCDKCRKVNDPNATFCTGCGNKLNKVVPESTNQINNNQNINVNTNVTPSYNQNINMNQTSTKKSSGGFSTGQKAIIIVLLLAVIGLLLFLVFNNKKVVKDDSRTIMIYICGSNLEYDAGIVTADLSSLDTNRIDLTKTNVLIYTGGTKEWKNNYIKNTENAIFKLTSTGFEKVQTYSKLNMGSPDTLSEFLNYVYNNYKSGKYDLIMYNHGGALDGAIYDDFTADNLSVTDIATAMKNSPFNSGNKLEAVLFRTCLNGTLEIATLFEPYSEYIVFSEEVSWGSPGAPVFGFINDLTPTDTGREFGIKFVDGYTNAMKMMSPYNTNQYTYSVIDLSKINGVISELDKFLSGVNIASNFNVISRIRSNMYQYGMDNKNYDTVDLYSLVSELKNYSSVSADKVLAAIDGAVIHSTTNLKNSNGLSVYFPYNGQKAYISLYLRSYKNMASLSNYHNFINNFNNTKSQPASYALSFSKNKTTTDSKNEVSIQLTPEQLENYARAKYAVFERNKEHPNYYRLIYIADDAVLSEDGKLTTQISNNLIKVTDKDKYTGFIPVFHLKNDGVESFYVQANLFDKTKNFGDKGYSFATNAFFKMNPTDAEIVSAVVSFDDDERAEGIMVDIERYNYAEMWCFDYKIHDAKGNYTSDWESAPTIYGFGGSLDELVFTRASIDDKSEFYVVFNIFDVNNQRNESKLIKVGK